MSEERPANIPKPRRPKRKRFQKERPVDPESVAATWRVFLAVPLPQPVIALVRELVAELGTTGWPVRWVSPDTAHITLHFIGEITPERAELLRLALPPIVARHAAFRLRTADLGVFPNQRRPRVIWLGLYGPAHRLQTLQTDLGRVLAELEFLVETGDFHPHVTLGRVRDTRNQSVRELPAAIQQKLAELAEGGEINAKNPRSVPVDEVVLYRSILSRGGARHEPIVRCPLGPPDKR
jgi:RNA 2',3'-cyclic 3'-phosphodiesterase